METALWLLAIALVVLIFLAWRVARLQSQLDSQYLTIRDLSGRIESVNVNLSHESAQTQTDLIRLRNRSAAEVRGLQLVLLQNGLAQDFDEQGHPVMRHVTAS